MITRLTRDAAANPKPGSPDAAPDETEHQIRSLHAKAKLDRLRDLALQLNSQRQQMHGHCAQLSVHQQELREQLESLLAPEQYIVTIAGVELEHGPLVEVAGLGRERVRLGVHPDVDPSHLIVGAAAVVSRERNCVLQVIAPVARWQNVATFERYLDSRTRILVRDRETLAAVDIAHHLQHTPLKKGDLIGVDREGAGIAYQRLDPDKSENLFDENVDDDFAELGGLDRQINQLKQIIDFRFRFPELAAKYSLKSKCGILLHGAPGNGKTRLARSCAGYVRRLFPDQPCRFMHVAGTQDYSLWLGESERKLITRFDAIRDASRDGPVVALWDEVDGLAKIRGSDHGSGAPDRILNTLLSQIDGVVPLENVVMLFATNRQDVLDPGFLRAGRIDEKIEIPPPSRRTAQAILARYLGRGLPIVPGQTDALIAPLLSRLFAPNGDYALVAEVKLADGRRLPVAGRQLLSGAMLEGIVAGAARVAAVREAETGTEGLTEEDLCRTLESELMSATALLTPANVKNYVTSIPQDTHAIAVEPILCATTPRYPR